MRKFAGSCSEAHSSLVHDSSELSLDVIRETVQLTNDVFGLLVRKDELHVSYSLNDLSTEV